MQLCMELYLPAKRVLFKQIWQCLAAVLAVYHILLDVNIQRGQWQVLKEDISIAHSAAGQQQHLAKS